MFLLNLLFTDYIYKKEHRMATTTTSTTQKEKASLPPKRGQIKAQIVSSFVKFVTSTATKGGKVMNGYGDNDGGGSTSSTPPPSAYNSDV